MSARRARWLVGALGALVLALSVAWFGLFAPVPVPEFAAVRAAYRPSESYLTDRHGEVIDSERTNFAVRRLGWTALAEVSPALVAAVLDGEDRRFWSHDGIDWLGVAAAVRDGWRHRTRRGASTITMQLASLLSTAERDHGGPRDVFEKRRQARYALALERRWSKQQILEAYLNLVHFRGELQGIGAAARLLAHKAPSGLEVGESQVLAALLPNPGAAAGVVAARACVRAARATGADGCADLRATAVALLGRNTDGVAVARLAPHLARSLLHAPGERLATTLDAGVQRLALDSLTRQLGELGHQNVRDGAAVVLDNATGDILAYVGSGGPLSRAPAVDGVRAPRQAGSTLKPFLYGLALERRYLTAASLLEDTPVNVATQNGIYLPQDYDHEYKGAVSVRTALGASLNVPAVRAAMLVGVDALQARLHEAGYAGIARSGDFYGYALALGSAEVTLLEQAAAYRTLALGGISTPLRLRADDPVAKPYRVLDAAASFIVADMLSDRLARVATFGLDNSLATPYWSAAKTGTSKDMRDNWCVGFTPRYTVAVWVGNFEGDSMRNVSGVTGAAPVWRDIMDGLERSGAAPAPPPVPGVRAVEVRFAGGREAPRREWFLPGTAPAAPIESVPQKARAVRITSPVDGLVVAVDPDIPEDRQRLPITIDGGTSALVVRLDEAVIGDGSQPILWAPRAGRHHVSVEDGRGRALDSVVVTVR